MESASKIRILYLTPGCFDKGGISRYCRYQIRSLREIFNTENVKVISFLGIDSNSFEEDFFVDWYGNNSRLFPKLKFCMVALYYTIIFRPSIIHVAHVNFSGLAKILCYLFGSKLVLNVYGREVWTKLSFDAKWGLSNAHTIISDCFFTKNYIIDRFLINKNKIHVIWDCVDSNRFYPDSYNSKIINKYKLPNPRNHKVILTLGRISKQTRYKGYERLIDLFKKIIIKIPDARLVFAGGGNFLLDLKKYAQENDIEKYIIFTDFIDENDLVDLYRMCDIFSLISIQDIDKGEGLPLTPLEAMSCGKPILVGNEDGSAEAISKEYPNGISISAYDVDSQFEFIYKLFTDMDYYNKYSKNAVIVSKQNFSYKKFHESHHKLFLNI